ncbi:MAG: NAD-dependent epimerase/dehydratase family protein [Bacteroidota bacterium]
MIKRVLVTGGAGFIGSHLVEKLVDEGHEVIVVDSLLRGNKIPNKVLKEIEFYHADIRDEGLLTGLGEGVDYIFHFAAILGVDIVADNPVETMDTEVQGMYSVAQCAIKNNIPKIIYASTSGVYGHHALEQSVTEDVMIDPKTSYAMAKRFNEIYLAALNEEKGITGIALRFFNVYGPRQDNRMVIPRFYEQAKQGEPITVYGSGNQTRDFTWIEDTIESSIKLAESIDGFEIFNIANENELSIGFLAEEIKKITGSKSEITHINAPSKRYDYEVGRRFGSSEKLYKAIGFKPNTSIQDGLKVLFENQ